VQQAFLAAAIRWFLRSGGAATPSADKIEGFKSNRFLNVKLERAQSKNGGRAAVSSAEECPEKAWQMEQELAKENKEAKMEEIPKKRQLRVQTRKQMTAVMEEDRSCDLILRCCAASAGS
jgi:hypothetical protein